MITIYGKENSCPSCKNAKRFANMKNIEFDFIELDSIEVLDEMKHRLGITGNVSIPQIFNDAEIIGGFKEFQSWVKEQIV